MMKRYYSHRGIVASILALGLLALLWEMSGGDSRPAVGGPHKERNGMERGDDLGARTQPAVTREPLSVGCAQEQARCRIRVRVRSALGGEEVAEFQWRVGGPDGVLEAEGTTSRIDFTGHSELQERILEVQASGYAATRVFIGDICENGSSGYDGELDVELWPLCELELEIQGGEAHSKEMLLWRIASDLDLENAQVQLRAVGMHQFSGSEQKKVRLALPQAATVRLQWGALSRKLVVPQDDTARLLWDVGETGVIAGEVRTYRGEPIADALVDCQFLGGASGGLHLRTRTAADGTFRFSRVRPGRVRLSCVKIRASKQLAFVEPGGETQVPPLVQAELVSLSGVVKGLSGLCGTTPLYLCARDRSGVVDAQEIGRDGEFILSTERGIVVLQLSHGSGGDQPLAGWEAFAPAENVALDAGASGLITVHLLGTGIPDCVRLEIFDADDEESGEVPVYRGALEWRVAERTLRVPTAIVARRWVRLVAGDAGAVFVAETGEDEIEVHWGSAAVAAPEARGRLVLTCGDSRVTLSVASTNSQNAPPGWYEWTLEGRDGSAANRGRCTLQVGEQKTLDFMTQDKGKLLIRVVDGAPLDAYEIGVSSGVGAFTAHRGALAVGDEWILDGLLPGEYSVGWTGGGAALVRLRPGAHVEVLVGPRPDFLRVVRLHRPPEVSDAAVLTEVWTYEGQVAGVFVATKALSIEADVGTATVAMQGSGLLASRWEDLDRGLWVLSCIDEGDEEIEANPYVNYHAMPGGDRELRTVVTGSCGIRKLSFPVVWLPRDGGDVWETSSMPEGARGRIRIMRVWRAFEVRDGRIVLSE